MAIELISFDDLNIFLGLSNTKTEVDYPDLTLIQESVVDMFQDYTNRTFELDSYVETRETGDTPTKMIKLEAVPVTEVTEVLIDGVATTDYKVKSYGIELGAKINNLDVQVAYSGGIEEVPGNLKRAALLQTVYEYQNKTSVGIEFVSTDGGSLTKPELGMLKEVKRLLGSIQHPYPVF